MFFLTVKAVNLIFVDKLLNFILKFHIKKIFQRVIITITANRRDQEIHAVGKGD